MRLSPLARKQWHRFRSIKRGYYARALIAAGLLAMSCFAEMLREQSRHRSSAIRASCFSRRMARSFRDRRSDSTTTTKRTIASCAAAICGETASGWVLMPPVPYSAFENDLRESTYPPYPPSFATRHYPRHRHDRPRHRSRAWSTDFASRSAFSLVLLALQLSRSAIAVGCAMGFWGGAFDLFFQRVIEVWSNVPFLYVIMIIASIVVPTFWTLTLVMVLFGWMSMTWYMRTSTYKEKTRDYVMAARALGAPSSRIVASPHSAEHGVGDRHVHSVFDRRRHHCVDGARLSGIRPAAADAELGRSAVAGHGQSRLSVDRHVGGHAR